jgi:hypothetical protein
MQVTILRLKIIFLLIFAISSVGVFAYHYYYVWPRDRCESAGKWWEPGGRVCAQPIMLPKLTGLRRRATPLRTSSSRAPRARRRRADGWPTGTPRTADRRVCSGSATPRR